jgi:RNase P subunit RPR2
MTTARSDDRPPPACERCGQPLTYLTTIPKRFDQQTGFTVLRCEACSHIQWQAKPER